MPVRTRRRTRHGRSHRSDRSPTRATRMWTSRSSAAAIVAGRRPTPVFPHSGPLTTRRSHRVAARRIASRRAAPCTDRLPCRPSPRAQPPLPSRLSVRAQPPAPSRLSQRARPPLPHRLSVRVQPPVLYNPSHRVRLPHGRSARRRHRRCPPNRRRSGLHRDRPSPRPGSQVPPRPDGAGRSRRRPRPPTPSRRQHPTPRRRRARRFRPTSARGPAHRRGSNRPDHTRRPLTRALCDRTRPDRPPRTPVSSHRGRKPAGTAPRPLRSSRGDGW
jgi:hypothetical protein